MMELAIPATKNEGKQSNSQSNFLKVLESAIKTDSNKTEQKKAVISDLQQLINIFNKDIPENFIAELQEIDVTNQQALFDLINKDNPDLLQTLQQIDEQMQSLLSNQNSLEFIAQTPIFMEEGASLSKIDKTSNEPFNALMDKTVQLLTQARQLGLRDILQIPTKDLGNLIDVTKKIQVSVQANEAHLLESQQSSELDSAFEELLQRVKTLESERRQQKLGNILENAFSKGPVKKDLHMLLPNQHMNIVKLNATSTNEEAPVISIHNQETISKTEQFVLHVGNGTAQEPKATDLIKAFSNILAKSQLSQTPGSSRLLIKLYPEHLGSLRVELLQKEGMLMARMIASSSNAKEMLDSQLHSLKQAFNQQNIQVDRIEVTFSQNAEQKYMNQHTRDEGNNRDGQSQSDHNGDENNDSPAFADELKTILFETEV